MIKKEFLKNAIAVSAISLCMNTAGIFFRAYASNRVGSETMGLLQLILSVYYPACTLASSGVYVASTQLCSRAMANNDRSIKRILGHCSVYGIAFGTLAFVLLYFCSGIISTKWLQYPDAEIPLKILSFALPFLAVGNALQGFFLSLRKAAYSSALQVTEDLSKMGATVLLFSLFLKNGPKAALCAMVAGMAIGEIVSTAVGFFLYRFQRNRISRYKNNAMAGTFGQVVRIALPCAVSGYLRSGIGMVESILVPRGLEASGLTQEQTLSVLGKLEGMALPVLIFPAAFLVIVSKLLVPEISAENAIGNKENNIKTTESVLRWTMVYAVAIAAFALLFGSELGFAIYRDTSCGTYIMLLAPLVPILYGDRVIDGIMKGYDRQLTSMKINLADALIQTVGAWILIPLLGIGGYIGLFCAGAVFNFTLSFLSLKKTCGIKFPVRKGILQPLTAAAAALLPLKLLGEFVDLSLWITAALAIPLFLFFLRILTDDGKKKASKRRVVSLRDQL